jgi:hypothetical protein
VGERRQDSELRARAPRFAELRRRGRSQYSWVTQWLVWNEPNQARWLRPTTPAVYVRQLLNPAYKAIHEVNPRAKVGGGVTAPRGSKAGVSPVNWIRGMGAAGARLDAYAHHPYPSTTRETPFADSGCKHCSTITMATLERLLTEVGRAFGPKRIWLTEYGYQTGAYGVTQQRQAELIGQSGLRVYKAPRVDMLIHYLVKDEPRRRASRAALFQDSGRRRIAALAFPFPISQAGRSGGNSFSGAGRPRSAPDASRPGAHRRAGASAAATQDRRARVLQRRVPPLGDAVRIFSPQDDAYSAPPIPSLAASQLRSEHAGAPPVIHGGFGRAVRLARARALPLRLRHRLLPRVRARPAAWDVLHQGLASSSDLLRRRRTSSSRSRPGARLAAAGAHRLGTLMNALLIGLFVLVADRLDRIDVVCRAGRWVRIALLVVAPPVLRVGSPSTSVPRSAPARATR